CRQGFKNTPFYHIVVTQSRSRPTKKPIEQLGTYNPIPDKDGIKAISLNFERAKVLDRRRDTVHRLLAKADIIPPKPRPGMSSTGCFRTCRKSLRPCPCNPIDLLV
ncbi:hypothetical protein B0O80DRAFT_437970, partial [Mortierella sp. GBAus27b]